MSIIASQPNTWIVFKSKGTGGSGIEYTICYVHHWEMTYSGEGNKLYPMISHPTAKGFMCLIIANPSLSQMGLEFVKYYVGDPNHLIRTIKALSPKKIEDKDIEIHY